MCTIAISTPLLFSPWSSQILVPPYAAISTGRITPPPCAPFAEQLYAAALITLPSGINWSCCRPDVQNKCDDEKSTTMKKTHSQTGVCSRLWAYYQVDHGQFCLWVVGSSSSKVRRLRVDVGCVPRPALHVRRVEVVPQPRRRHMDRAV